MPCISFDSSSADGAVSVANDRFRKRGTMSKHWITERFAATILLAVSLGASSRPLAAQALCATGTVCVKAWQQDTPSLCTGCAYRTGANLTETMITNSSIQNGRVAHPFECISKLHKDEGAPSLRSLQGQEARHSCGETRSPRAVAE
jgi:hypothetical protein